MDDASELFRNLSGINLIQVGLIVVTSWLLIAASQQLLTGVANRLPSRYRLFLLASVPVLRLLIIAGAIVLVVPRLIDPTFESLVALLGAECGDCDARRYGCGHSPSQAVGPSYFQRQ